MIANELEYAQALLDEVRRLNLTPVTFDVELSRGRTEDRTDVHQPQPLPTH
jgi:hypothetical protein